MKFSIDLKRVPVSWYDAECIWFAKRSNSQGLCQRHYHVEALQNMENWGYFTFQKTNNKGTDYTARMRRLVCTFVVRKQQSQGFSPRGPYDVEAPASWPPPGYAPDSDERVVDCLVLVSCKLWAYCSSCMSCIYLLGAIILLYSLIVAFPGKDHLGLFSVS